MILALIAAAKWARQAGIEFKWVPSDEFDEETGDRLARVNAYRAGEPIGYSDGWYAEAAGSTAERYQAEAELSLAVMGCFNSIASEYVQVALNGSWTDG